MDTQREGTEVVEGMKKRLVGEAEGRPTRERPVFEELDGEPELGRERGIVFERASVVVVLVEKRRAEVARDASEAAVDPAPLGVALDEVDGEGTALPAPGGPPERPKRFARSERRRSVTYVRCAEVFPVSPAPMRSRSKTATRLPACLSRWAAVSPVMPPPMIATSIWSGTMLPSNRGRGALRQND